MRLYDLNQKYQDLLNYAQSVDFTDEEQRDLFHTTLETLDDAIEEKAENIAHVLKQLEYDELVVGEEIKRLQGKKRALSNNHASLKKYLQESMEFTGKEKIKTPKFSINIQNNPPKLVVDDEKEIPKAYWIEQEPKLDRRLLLNDLKEEEYPDFKGAHIEQERSLRIR